MLFLRCNHDAIFIFNITAVPGKMAQRSFTGASGREKFAYTLFVQSIQPLLVFKKGLGK